MPEKAPETAASPGPQHAAWLTHCYPHWPELSALPTVHVLGTGAEPSPPLASGAELRPLLGPPGHSLELPPTADCSHAGLAGAPDSASASTPAQEKQASALCSVRRVSGAAGPGSPSQQMHKPWKGPQAASTMLWMAKNAENLGTLQDTPQGHHAFPPSSSPQLFYSITPQPSPQALVPRSRLCPGSLPAFSVSPWGGTTRG